MAAVVASSALTQYEDDRDATMSAPPAPSDIFSITDDELRERLHFIREIGFGNWGSVWSCYTKDSPVREKVAVKLVHRSKTPTTAARVKSLWNEMKIHRAFKGDAHPSIVAFHSFIITPSYALIAMEYLPRLIPVEVHESKAKTWFESLLGGVHFLHSHKVTHNDIKPANILLTATLVPVLVDFGFAEHYSSHKTPRDKMFMSNLAYGTPEYLSPERAKGLKHDTRLSDVWSLGVTFFEILIGRTPFEEIEGESFETQKDLELYWERTKKGIWLNEDDWSRKMSSGMQRLLRRMMCPDLTTRITAAEALADPFWRNQRHPMVDRSYLATPPGIVNVAPEVPRSAGANSCMLDKHAKATAAPSNVPSQKSATKKKSKNRVRRKRSQSTPQQSPVKTAKPATTAATVSPATSRPITAPLSISSVSPAITTSRPASSGIPVPKRRQTAVRHRAADEGSDKENGRAGSSSKAFHVSKKVPSRKPIPAALQASTMGQRDNALPEASTSSSRARVPSIVNKSALLSVHARSTTTLSTADVQKHLDDKASLGFSQKDKGKEKQDEDADADPYNLSGMSLDLGGIDSKGRIGSVKIDHQKGVLDLVKDVKAAMLKDRARLIVLEEADADDSLLDTSLETPADDSLDMDTSGDLPVLFPNDTLSRSTRASTPASIFKQSFRMSMDKLGITSTIPKPEPNRISVQDLRDSFDDADVPLPPTPVVVDEREDRMTAWIRNVEKVVEETRTTFQNQQQTTVSRHSRQPSLPPRMVDIDPSRRASTKVHPVLMVDTPGGTRKRRATVGSSTAPEIVLADAAMLDEHASLRPRSSIGYGHGHVIGHITPVANLEQELMRSQSPAPQRLSAVIDPKEFASTMIKMKDAEPRQSGETDISASKDCLPAIEVTVEQDSRPQTPCSSITDVRRRSASSVMLLAMDREREKEYDQILLSTNAVSRLGRGYQSELSMRRRSAAQPSDSNVAKLPPTPSPTPIPASPSKLLHRRSIFKGLGVKITSHAEAKVVQSMDDIGSRRKQQTYLQPPPTPAPTLHLERSNSSVAGRVKKAFRDILMSPRKVRTFGGAH